MRTMSLTNLSPSLHMFLTNFLSPTPDHHHTARIQLQLKHNFKMQTPEPIRYPDNRPVELLYLNDLLGFYNEDPQGPHVFLGLIQFYTLLTDLALGDHWASDDLIHRWEKCRQELKNPKNRFYHDEATCEQTLAMIAQLPPVDAYRELTEAIVENMHGERIEMSPYFREYVSVSRNWDYVICCAAACHDLTPECQSYLHVMYQMQPFKSVDTDWEEWSDGRNATLWEDWGHGTNLLKDTITHAAGLDGDGPETMVVPMVKFWLRQVLTVMKVWNVALHTTGTMDMPEYGWFVAAYERLWERHQALISNPFSDYPYLLRQELLSRIQYSAVFEHCWKLVSSVAELTPMVQFDPVMVSSNLYTFVVQTVKEVLETWRLDTQFLTEHFGDDNKYLILTEGSLVPISSIQDSVVQHRYLVNGLGDQFYPLDFDPDEGGYASDEGSDADDEGAGEQSGDEDDDERSDRGYRVIEYDVYQPVELEAYGSDIDLDSFVIETSSSNGAFCTFCQDDVFAIFGGQRCVQPRTCSHTFHAQCVYDWVNSASSSSNLCPNCKVQMTPEQRPRRPLGSGDEE